MKTNKSVDQLATELNQELIRVYPNTDKEGDIRFSMIAKEYNRVTFDLLDMLIFKLYGLYYKEYVVFEHGKLFICPFKVEKVILRSLKYYKNKKC